MPRVTFTDPQVSAVGLTEAQARERGIDVRTVSYGTGDVAGAYVLGNGIKGTSKLVIDESRRVLVGATFTGPATQELRACGDGRHRRIGHGGRPVARRTVLPDGERGLATAP